MKVLTIMQGTAKLEAVFKEARGSLNAVDRFVRKVGETLNAGKTQQKHQPRHVCSMHHSNNNIERAGEIRVSAYKLSVIFRALHFCFGEVTNRFECWRLQRRWKLSWVCRPSSFSSGSATSAGAFHNPHTQTHAQKPGTCLD